MPDELATAPVADALESQTPPSEADRPSPEEPVGAPPSGPSEQELQALRTRQGRELAAERRKADALAAQLAAQESELTSLRTNQQAIIQRLRQEDTAREQAALERMTPEQQAEYWAKRAQAAAQQPPPPATAPEPRRLTAAELLADANAHFGFTEEQALRPDEFPPEALKNIEAFRAVVNALANTRFRAASPPESREEQPVATPKKEDPEVQALKARIAELEAGQASTPASRPNAARPAPHAATLEPSDIARIVQSARPNQEGSVAVRARLKEARNRAAAQAPRV